MHHHRLTHPDLTFNTTAMRALQAERVTRMMALWPKLRNVPALSREDHERMEWASLLDEAAAERSLHEFRRGLAPLVPYTHGELFSARLPTD